MNTLSPSLLGYSAAIALFLPRILVAVVLFVVGLVLAKICKRMVVKAVQVLVQSPLVASTPIEHFLSNADLLHRVDEFLGGVVYWFVLLLTTYVVSATVGLTSVSYLIEQLFSYLPRLFSAGIVLIVGVVLAGMVESFTKRWLTQFDPKAARLTSKLTSYLVMVLTLMIAFSELGIARDFILILFVGLVLALSLGMGLALGLGGQTVVRQLLEHWVLDSKVGSAAKKKASK